MPISQINPDGSVKIYNSKTGATMDVAPGDLPKYSSKLVGQYQEQLQKLQATKVAAQGISSGDLKVGDLPAEQRASVVSQIQQSGGKIPTNDKKTDQSVNSVLNLISNLENHYSSAAGDKTDIGPVNRILGMLTGGGAKLGINDSAKLYQNEKEGFAATLKSLTGDTGVLTDQDYARLSKLLPGFGATPGEAKGAFEDLRSQIAAKYGSGSTKTTYKTKQGSNTGNPIVDTLKNTPLIGGLLGNALNTAQDVGTGVKSIMQQPNLNKNMQIADDLGKRAKDAFDKGDFQTAGLLSKQARELATGVGDESKTTQQGFTQDVNMNPILRGILTGADVAGAAELPGLPSAVKGIAKKAPTAGKDIAGKVFTDAAGKSVRESAIAQATQAGKTIPGENIAEALVKWGDKAAPGNLSEGRKVERIVADAIDQFGGKKLTPQEAFDIWHQIDSGFKQSGMTKTTVQGLADKALRDAIRQELDRATGGAFEQGTKMISKGIGRKDFAKKLGYGVGFTLATGASANAIGGAINKVRGQ